MFYTFIISQFDEILLLSIGYSASIWDSVCKQSYHLQIMLILSSHFHYFYRLMRTSRKTLLDIGGRKHSSLLLPLKECCPWCFTVKYDGHCFEVNIPCHIWELFFPFSSLWLVLFVCFYQFWMMEFVKWALSIEMIILFSFFDHLIWKVYSYNSYH